MSNPLNHLPRPGQVIKLPDGYVMCETLSVDQRDRGCVCGEVVLKFKFSTDLFRQMSEPAALPGAVDALEAGATPLAIEP